MAKGVSVEDRSKRAETVRPPHDEHCECQFASDSALSGKSEMNDIELNGETDDEDMEDGETGFDYGNAPVRNIHDRGQPTVSGTQRAHEDTSTLQMWCKFCVMGRGVKSPHRRSDAQDDLEGVHHVSLDCGFLGEKESEELVTPVLVIRERRHKITWAMLVPRKGTELLWIARRAAKVIDQLGHNRVTLRCDNEPAMEALARGFAQARQEGSQRVPERPPERASPTESSICTVRLVAGIVLAS